MQFSENLWVREITKYFSKFNFLLYSSACYSWSPSLCNVAFGKYLIWEPVQNMSSKKSKLYTPVNVYLTFNFFIPERYGLWGILPHEKDSPSFYWHLCNVVIVTSQSASLSPSLTGSLPKEILLLSCLFVCGLLSLVIITSLSLGHTDDYL